jgi:hypothetical protein
MVTVRIGRELGLGVETGACATSNISLLIKEYTILIGYFPGFLHVCVRGNFQHTLSFVAVFTFFVPISRAAGVV